MPTTSLIGAHGYCTQVRHKSNGLGVLGAVFEIQNHKLYKNNKCALIALSVFWY